MGSETRAKMPPEARAKQFMPFAALKGFEAALSLQEKKTQQKAALDEEEVEKINRILNKLTVGDEAKLIYSRAGRYTPAGGTVRLINEQRQYLELDETRIFFDDILKFEEIEVRTEG